MTHHLTTEGTVKNMAVDNREVEEALLQNWCYYYVAEHFEQEGLFGSKPVKLGHESDVAWNIEGLPAKIKELMIEDEKLANYKAQDAQDVLLAVDSLQFEHVESYPKRFCEMLQNLDEPLSELRRCQEISGLRPTNQQNISHHYPRQMVFMDCLFIPNNAAVEERLRYHWHQLFKGFAYSFSMSGASFNIWHASLLETKDMTEHLRDNLSWRGLCHAERNLSRSVIHSAFNSLINSLLCETQFVNRNIFSNQSNSNADVEGKLKPFLEFLVYNNYLHRCSRIYSNGRLIEVLVNSLESCRIISSHVGTAHADMLDYLKIRVEDRKLSGLTAGKLRAGDMVGSVGEDTASRIGLIARDVLDRPYLITTLHGLNIGRGQVRKTQASFYVSYYGNEGELETSSFTSQCIGYHGGFTYTYSRKPTIVDIAAILFTRKQNEPELPDLDTLSQHIILRSSLGAAGHILSPKVKIIRSSKNSIQTINAEIIDTNGLVKRGKIWYGGNLILKQADNEELFAGPGDSGSLVVSEIGGNLVACGLLHEMFMVGDERRYVAMNLEVGLRCLWEVLGLELSVRKVQTEIDNLHNIISIQNRNNTREEARVVDDTPVHAAVRQRNLVELQRLVDESHDINAPGFENLTPLMIAAGIVGDVELTRFLLQRGAVVEARGGVDAGTAAHLASSHGWVDALNILLRQAPGMVNITDQHGQAPLHIAARFGQVACVETLLAAGSDSNLVDSQGKTAQDVACQDQGTDILRSRMDELFQSSKVSSDDPEADY